jgi:hypothetical protein
MRRLLHLDDTNVQRGARLRVQAGELAMQPAFDSRLMDVEIVGSTVKYTYRADRKRSYEIRGVTDLDLARLRQTIGNERYSTSATIQLLSHRYKTSHYYASGKPARPCRIRESELLPKTPFAR